ncbi:MAG TPA: hypothetical protein VLX68_06640 [Chitinivibrionales bacterium]|nr:hypothetical protein [Chitinivibrionales bacterium]
MRDSKLIYALLFVVGLISFSQSALVHQRDTLHILNAYGRGVYFSNTMGGQLMVDSVASNMGAMPCSLSYKEIFFAVLGGMYACPCCPTWSIGSARPFFRSASKQINWSSPLSLTDSLQFRICDTSSPNSRYCTLPEAIPNSDADNIFIFGTTSIFVFTTYVLVRVDTLYLDPAKPTQTFGGQLGYPVETCKNMLVVDIYVQPNGSTDFSGAQITSTLFPSNRERGTKYLMAKTYSSFQLFDLQGRAVSFICDGTHGHVPCGCYLEKRGTYMTKRAFIY